MTRLRPAIAAAFAALLISIFYSVGKPVSAPFVDNVYVEELTWVEVRDHLKRGHTTMIVPTGGVEQNGPHMVLGKHNYVVREAAGRLARRLGNALVAPTITYVPEGSIEKRDGHMAYPGTFTIPEDTYETLLEYAARSAIAHGATEILFIGDSLYNQPAQERVAERLSVELAAQKIRVRQISDYYDPKRNRQIEYLKSTGFDDQQIGGHAGIRDTSEVIVAFPEGVRMGLRKLHGGAGYQKSGVHGDPRLATAEIGEKMFDLKVEAAFKQIMSLRAADPTS